MSAALAVIAKAPVAGRCKTRLSPPLSPGEAASLAEAALMDTLAAVLVTDAARKVLVLDGRPGPWLPDGFEVIAQRGAGLDERLANAFEDLGGPAVIIGMDTPQVRADALERAVHDLRAADAVLGPAVDGGYWAIGLKRPDRRTLLGIPMSTDRTYAAQLARLRGLGLRVARLRALRDVDTFADALAVARIAPLSRFAAALGAAASPDTRAA